MNSVTIYNSEKRELRVCNARFLYMDYFIKPARSGVAQLGCRVAQQGGFAWHSYGAAWHS